MKCKECAVVFISPRGMPLTMCPVCHAGSGTKKQTIAFQPPAKVGSTYPFGGYDWRVLDVQRDKMLIITKNIFTQRPYCDLSVYGGDNITWECSTLRQYLNGGFYRSFVKADRDRIVLSDVDNPDGEWTQVSGGNPTKDYIFLLSVEEVARYFGDGSSVRVLNNRPKMEQYEKNIWEKSFEDFSGYWSKPENMERFKKQGFPDYTFWIYNKNDQRRNSEDRMAKCKGSASWWWLRSPGYNSRGAAYIRTDGRVNIPGNYVNDSSGGVRPALWLNL